MSMARYDFNLPHNLQKMGIGQGVMKTLMSFKASERKDDPSRRPNLHGPYEEFTLLKTGRLPADYYEAGSAEPWGLRTLESRSNILWQILSGVMDRQPELASSYMSLALDNSLSEDDYAKELKSLNADWRKYLVHAGVSSDHEHKRLRGVFSHISCAACSVLTAAAIRDAGIHSVFEDMLPMNAADRKNYLQELGLAPFLNTIIPTSSLKLERN